MEDPVHGRMRVARHRSASSMSKETVYEIRKIEGIATSASKSNRARQSQLKAKQRFEIDLLAVDRRVSNVGTPREAA